MRATETQLKTLIVDLADYYGHALTPNQVRIHAKVLEGLEIEDLKRAVMEIMADPNIKFYPLPAVVRAKAKPQVDDRLVAMDLAKAIVARIIRRGYTWPTMFQYDGHKSFKDAVIADLGELAWNLIERRGGWLRVHDEFFASDEVTFTAQLRDHIHAVMQMAKAGNLTEKPALPAPVRPNIRAQDQAPVQIGELLGKRKASGVK